MDSEDTPRHPDFYAFIAGLCGGVGYILLVALTLAPYPFIAVPLP